ncbi:MAG: site-2 protease family protein [Clostridiales bacterium]|jgi:Zn-dependent protease|nr:site-2 protease family protein [Clostridiales bacterium]
MGLLESIRQDPAGTLQFLLYMLPAVLLALTFHEVAHGWVAWRCGDPTAKLQGRLSLNPLKHLNPIGTLSMLLLGFGWAKPVPVNPYNYRNGRLDDLKVSLAGVTTNFLLFLVSTLLSYVVGLFLYHPQAVAQVGMKAFLGFGQDLYSWQLVPSNDNILMPLMQVPWLIHVQRFLLHFSRVNLGLCLFNLLPIPPLDGFHVFNDILLKGRLRMSGRAFQITMVALIVLMFATDIVSNVVSAASNFIQSLVLGGLSAVFGV